MESRVINANDVGTAIFRAAHDPAFWLMSAASKALEQPEERFLRAAQRMRLPWNHCGLDGIVRPLFTRHGIEHVDIHHANKAVVAENEMAAAPRPQNSSAYSSRLMYRQRLVFHDS